MTAPRTYLDWNAAAPLRPEAREAMQAAMDAAGNPSSVHAEGREARAMLETARARVAALVGCEPGAIVFTASASEAAATAIAAHDGPVHVSPASHDCLTAHIEAGRRPWPVAAPLAITPDGRVDRGRLESDVAPGALVCVSWASGETGVIESGMLWRQCLDGGLRLLRDAAQVAGKVPFDASEPWSDLTVLSSGKLGGPKGVGALIVRDGIDIAPLVPGGGQEMRRRSGTENVIGIAGFGAAAEAALRDLRDGAWERVASLRNILESALADAAPDLHVVGRNTERLPNTSCFAVRGWKGETQVMQMDLAGFAVSAGSACSSGKVGPSGALIAMGHDEETAASAIRVSIGPTTTEAEVIAFAEAWARHYRRRRAEAA